MTYNYHLTQTQFKQYFTESNVGKKFDCFEHRPQWAGQCFVLQEKARCRHEGGHSGLKNYLVEEITFWEEKH